MFTNKNSNTYFTVAFAIKSSPSIELIKRIHTITLDCSASSRIRTSMDFSTLPRKMRVYQFRQTSICYCYKNNSS